MIQKIDKNTIFEKENKLKNKQNNNKVKTIKSEIKKENIDKYLN
jgi:hypothetical protein